MRICPNCEITLGLDGVVSFDNENNLICVACQLPVIPTSTQAETKMKPKNPLSFRNRSVQGGHATGKSQGGITDPLGLRSPHAPGVNPMFSD